MGPQTVLVGLVVMGFLGVVAWQIVQHRRRPKWDSSAYPGLTRISRWTLGLRYAGVAVGLAVLPISVALGDDRTVLVLAPVLTACVILGCLIAGEVICFGTARQPGVAGLERRTVKSYLNWPLLAMLAAITVGLGLMLIWGSGLANESGRQFSVSCVIASQDEMTTLVSPFVGASYARLLLIGFGVAWVLAAITISIIVRRSRNGADPDLALWDDALRRRSARAVVITLIAATSASLFTVVAGFRQAFDMVRSYYGPGGVIFSEQCLGPVQFNSTKGWAIDLLLQRGVGFGLVLIFLAAIVLVLAAAAGLLIDFRLDVYGQPKTMASATEEIDTEASTAEEAEGGLTS